MLTRDARRELVCRRCGLTVDTRVARYAFVLIADRGRGGITMRPDLRTLLCGPCGDQLRNMAEEFGLLEVIHCGKASTRHD